MSLDHLGIDQVRLGDYLLPISGPVQRVKATTQASKVTIGESKRSDQTLADEWVQDDWREGMLRLKYDGSTDQGRFWWNTADTTRVLKLILPPQVTSLGAPPGETNPADVLVMFRDLLYVSFGGHIYTWDETNLWSTQLHDLGTIPTQAKVFNNELYYALGSGYVKYDGAGVWADYATPLLEYLETFDVNPNQKLLGIDGEGLLYASIDGVTWDTQVGGQLRDVSPAGLIAFRNANDDPALMITTDRGLYSADVWTKTIYPTSLQVIPAPDTGVGATVWIDGALYFPATLSIWKYPTSGQITNMGLDRDDGLPAWVRGRVTYLLNTPSYLLAVVDATRLEQTSQETLFMGMEFGVSHLPQIQRSGYSAILAFNGQGWHNLYLSNTGGQRIRTVVLTSAFGSAERRIIFGDGPEVFYMRFPEGNYDPTQDPSWTYRDEGILQSSWFDADQSELKKIALSVHLGCQNISASEVVDVYYATDYQEVWEYLGSVSPSTIRADGRTVLHFNDRKGLRFYAMALKFVLRRGSDATKSPVMLYFDLHFRKKMKTVWGWSFTVDGSRLDHLENTWEAIQAMVDDPDELFQFAYRTTDDLKYHYVDVLSVQGQETAGLTPSGNIQITVAELDPAWE